MKNLIVNADDLGLTSGVTNGIVQACSRGIVTSTSAIMNKTHISSDLNRTRQACPRLGIGVHLIITEGQPLLPASEVPSLVDKTGRFLELHHHPEYINRINPYELRAEWEAQINAFIALGFKPDHLDSHHHISYYNPDIFKVMLGLAREFGLPIRYPPLEFIGVLGKDNVAHWLKDYGVKAPHGCITSFYGEDNAISKEKMLEIIRAIGEGTYEVMCHPGYADEELIESSSYNKPREQELAVLTSAEVMEAVQAEGISLVSFSKLWEPFY